METGLRDKVVLVTGASGGLGREMVRAFADEGARVVVHCRGQHQAAAAVAKQLPPGRHLIVQADLTDEQAVDRLWSDAEQQLGPIEIVVANAAIWPPEDIPLTAMSLEHWTRTVTTNLTSVFLCMRAFFRGIERHRLADPAAVLIGSTAAVFGEAGHADYAAAKGGLVHGFMLSLKNEITRLAVHGRVNAVCPGWTVTPMTAGFMENPHIVRRALQTIALRKVGRPSDVAAAVLFLASGKLSGHISGQMLMVSGGMEGRALYDLNEIDPSQA